MTSDLASIRNVYFIGIGGIGMSALARWFKANGRNVAGYDLQATTLTQSLEKEGIAVHYEDDVNAIPAVFRQDKQSTLVVYTPAVPANHSELLFFQYAGFQVKKRAEVLGIIVKGLRGIAVAGTHGKTTTSSMLAHVLRQAGVNCTAFVGGITQNYQTNLLLNDSTQPETFVVVEADEYDRSFLHLHPEIAILTSTDADHLDIYGSAQEVVDTYTQFALQVQRKIFVSNNVDTTLIDKIPAHKRSIYAKSATMALQANYFAENVRIEDGLFIFDFIDTANNQHSINDICLSVPGMHNIENATAVIAACVSIGLHGDVIREALSSFRGVKRRFEYILRTPKVIQIDDYAHHPTEVEAFLRAARALYPQRHITVIFQPHLFSRTKDFYELFAQSLSLSDALILLPIYPAREQQTDFPTTTSQIILDRVQIPDKQLVAYEKVLEDLSQRTDLDVVVTMGAGNIDKLIAPIKQLLEKR